VGLLAGVATPTELGALTVVYAAALGFAQRELKVHDLLEACRDTFVTCGVPRLLRFSVSTSTISRP